MKTLKAMVLIGTVLVVGCASLYVVLYIALDPLLKALASASGVH